MPSANPVPLPAEALDRLRRCAENAARAGGLVAKRYFRTELSVRLKADRSEVSEADEEAQAAVVASLRAARPEDVFLTEETLRDGPLPAAGSPESVCWVIDPIDGTRNFVRGVPLYVTSVAALIAGVPVAGAIYEPERDTLYSAIHTGPVLVNDVVRPPISGAVGADRRDARPLVAIPSNPRGPIAALARDWLGRFICRNLGSTALHLALVATGEFDAMLADNPRLWDLAAGAVLIGAAGAVMTAPSGAPLFPVDVCAYRDEELPVLAARAALHGQLVADGTRPAGLPAAS